LKVSSLLETTMNYLQLQHNISHYFLKTSLHCIKHKFKNVATALPILDDKDVPNFYDNFVNF